MRLSGNTNGTYPRAYTPPSNNGVDSGKNEFVNEDNTSTDFSLREFLDIMLKGKWSIISSFSIVFIAVAVYTFMQDPEYQAHSTLMVDTKNTPKTMEDLVMGTASRNVYNEVEVLKSRMLAERVAQRMIDQYEATGEAFSVLGNVAENPPTLRSVSERLMGRFSDVRPVSKDVDMIRVTSTSTDPQEAMVIANLYADEYIANNKQKSRVQMQESKEFLQERADELQTDITEIEDQIETIQGGGGVSLQAEASQLLRQIGDLEAKRDEASVQLEANKAVLVGLRERLQQAEPGLVKRMTSGVEGRIANLQEKIFRVDSEIEDFYAKAPSLRNDPSSNPTLVEKLAQRTEYQKQLDTLANQLTSEVASAGGIDPTADGNLNPLVYLSQLRTQIAEKEIEVKANTSALNAYDRRLGQYRALLGRIPANTIAQARQERQLEARDQMYGILTENLLQTTIAEKSEIGYANIVDRAVDPKSPVRPNVALNLILGSLFGLVLGMCLVFLRNAMDNRIRKPEDIRKIGVTVLGVVPDMMKVVKDDFDGRERITGDGRSYSTSLIALLNPLSPISETYRRLRTNIQFSRLDRDVQVIMVTSSGPGEGKTVTASNLAITMAQAGRPTLYIDADLRRPTGHKMLGLPREPGLVELLFEKYPFDLEAFATGIDDLYAIPAGSSVPNPAELMGSKKMKDMVNRLREEFDYIIIDTPPVLAVTDAVLLSTECDASVVVISANETDFHSLQRTVEALRAVDASLAGTVLNRFNVKRAYGYYGYRYSYGYGYGYGYGKYGYDYYGDSGRAPKKEETGILKRFSKSKS